MKKFFVRFKYGINHQASLILTLKEDAIIDLTLPHLKAIIMHHKDFKPIEFVIISPEDIDVMIMTTLN